MLKYNINFEELCDIIPKWTWQELKYGINKSIISNADIIKYAKKILSEELEQFELVLELAIANDDEVEQILFQLASWEEKEEVEEIEGKWIFAIIYENYLYLSEKVFDVIETVYVEFNYPEQIANLISYMPCEGGPTREEELDRYIKDERYKRGINMSNFMDVNDNPITKKWKKRYNEQPEHIKKELDELSSKSIKEYQLNVIKRKRNYPQIGDVFLVEPRENVVFWGIVMNNHVCNINGDDLLVIMIFKERVQFDDSKKKIIDYDNLLIAPCMVGPEYWTRGYFYTVENMECGDCDYGFYSMGKDKYFDEYGQELKQPPKLLGIYGVSTISGIAHKINVELIIDKDLLR